MNEKLTPKEKQWLSLCSRLSDEQCKALYGALRTIVEEKNSGGISEERLRRVVMIGDKSCVTLSFSASRMKILSA